MEFRQLKHLHIIGLLLVFALIVSACAPTGAPATDGGDAAALVVRTYTSEFSSKSVGNSHCIGRSRWD